MRRKEKQVDDRGAIDAIIRDSEVCRLAMSMNNRPYLVPLNFGYDGEAIYIHTADSGLKIDHFLANPHVCFEFETKVSIREHHEKACKWSAAFESVIGFGTIGELKTPEERRYGLNQIMHQYSGRDWDLADVGMPRLRVWRISIETLSGKRSQG